MTEEKSQQDIPGNPVNVETIPMPSQNTIADQFPQALGLSDGITTIHGAGQLQFISIRPLPQFFTAVLDF